MFKKTAAVLLALVLGLSASFAFAQSAAFPPEAQELFSKEAPLTQADVDLYLRALPEIPAAMASPEALEALHTKLGLGEIRFSYIVAKIGLAHALATGSAPEQLNLSSLPEAVRPTEADKALVAKNLDTLTRATLDMKKKLEQQ